MKVSAVIITLSAMISMALAAFMYWKRTDMEKIITKANFMDIKVGVTRDVLAEYQSEVEKLRKLHDETAKALEPLESAANAVQNDLNKKYPELEACGKDLRTVEEETVASEKELRTGQDQFEKEKAQWSEEIAELKAKLEQKSKVCDFVKKDSVEGMKLCGTPITEAPKKAAPNAEAKPKKPK
ncbi:hypothetical protein GJAV_G00008020 [Gymnothorax javanicus]|nr:hypothetical protein GJAV_G00008020 [Gymnothorax javanicus]